MKQLTPILYLLSIFTSSLFAQQKNVNADILIEQAYAYASEEENSLAISKLKEAIVLDSTYANTWLALGHVYYGMEDYPKAIIAGNKILVLENVPDTILFDAYDLIGFSHIKRENYVAAIEIYSEGILRYPTTPLLYFGRGLAYWENKKTDEAFSDFKTCIYYDRYYFNAHQAILELAVEQEKVALTFLSASYLLVNFYGNQYAEYQFQQLETIQSKFVQADAQGKYRIQFPKQDEDTTDNLKSLHYILAKTIYQNTAHSSSKENNAFRFARIIRNLAAFAQTSTYPEKGNFWKTYVQYFIEMNNNGYTDLLSHIIYINDPHPSIKKWARKNFNKVKNFDSWNTSYDWKR